MQYGPPRDPQDLNHSEDHQNSQNLTGISIETEEKKELLSACEFENMFGISFLPHLEFAPRLSDKVIRKTKKLF